MTWPEQAPKPAKALSASFSHAGHQDDRELGFEPIKHTARRLKAFWGTQGRWPRRKIAGTSGLVWAGASGAQEAPQAQAQKKARQASSRAGRSPQARGTWGVRGLFIPCRDEVFVLFHLERSEHRYALGCVIPAVDVVTRLI